MRKITFFILFLFLSFIAVSQDNAGAGAPEGNRYPCQTATLTGDNVSCFGEDDGSITVKINLPGTYKIRWSTGDSIPSTTLLQHSISGLEAGYYDVQVINLASGCVAFDIINVTQPAVITATHTWNDVKCYGQSTGNIDLTVSGGTPGYSYLWSNGATTSDLVNIDSGQYFVTVTDAEGCVTHDSAVIIEPAQPLDFDLTSKDPDCNGFNDAWAHLTVWGGTPPYTYQWNTGAFSQNLDNLTAGNYQVTVTDANLCKVFSSVMITNPPMLMLSTTSQNNLCAGQNLGTADLTVSGGTLPYTYAWQNSTYVLSWPTEDLTGLANDTYFVTVSDSNGCYRSDSVVISSPAALTSSIIPVNVTSFGGMNGSIDLSVSGGLTPYSYAWSNGATSQDLSGIPAGLYSVTITDINGCTRQDSVYISEPLSPLGASLALSHVSCFGGSDGTIMAVASGGTAPYTFLWSNGNTTDRIEGLSAGLYSLTVTDFFGNTFTTSDSILQPEMITFTYNVTNVSCSGLPDGGIDVTVAGGTPSYTYKWYNSDYVLAALTEDISAMPADQYYLQVTDTIGCFSGISITITQPPVMNLTLDYTNAYCAGSATGTATATVTGGSQPYTYQWSNGATTPQILNLAAGGYSLTVTDAHTCFVSDSVTITQTDSIRLTFDTEPVSCSDQHDGTARVWVTGGNGSYSYNWSNTAVTPEIINLDAGNYQVTVTDLMGCAGMGEAVVTKIEIDCINIPTCFTPNDDGLNDVWVIKDAALYPEFFMEIYNRWGQLVYSLNNTYTPWDGTFDGKPLPSETYYYFIRISSQSETLQGNVTIIR